MLTRLDLHRNHSRIKKRSLPKGVTGVFAQIASNEKKLFALGLMHREPVASVKPAPNPAPNRTISLASLDFVGCVCFTGNKERHDLLLGELQRVGISNPQVFWTFPSPYRNFVLSRIKHAKSLDELPGFWGAAIGHYHALKTAYELGSSYALIVEDDCRFLKDKNLIDKALAQAPADWSILMLDSIAEKKVSRVNDFWSAVESARSAACYIVNRQGMKSLIMQYELPILHPNYPMLVCDYFTDRKILGEKFGLYIASPNLAVQCLAPGRSNSGGNQVFNFYNQKKLDISNYAPYSSSRINILFCVDGSSRGREMLQFSLNSLFKLYHHNDDIQVFVASTSPYSRQGVTFIDANKYIDKYGLGEIATVRKPGCPPPSPMQIFRLCAPVISELQNIDRILYLDIDVEVVGCGINGVFSKPFNADVMALFEHSKHGKESTDIMLKSEELLSYMSDNTKQRLRNGGYFNSGVMLMNLAHMRSHHPTWGDDLPNIVNLAVKHHRKVVDQDITNVMLDAVPLPPAMNVMPNTDVAIPNVPPIIIHYAGIAKYANAPYPPPQVRAKAFRTKT